jgi:phosphoglycolate phosphatase
MIKLIIFDFDGVVADSFGVGLKIWKEIASKKQIELKLSTEDIKILGFKGLMKKVGVSKYKIPLFIHRVRKLMNAHMGEVKSFPEMKTMLMELKKGRKLVLVTSNSRENVRIFLKNNKMEEVFDFIIAGVGIFGKSKHMKKAVKIAKVEKMQTLCVGDEVRDIEAANKAGLKIVAVSWGFNSRKLLQKHKQGHIVNTPKSLLKLVKTLDNS